MKLLITIFIVFIPFFVPAQDLTGIWTGYLRTPGSELPYELTISDEGYQLSGYSMIIYINNGVENIGIKTAKIKRKKNELNFEDDELVYDNFKMEPVRTKMTGSVRLLTRDTLMILSGSFSTRSIDFRDTRKYSGEIYLEKRNPDKPAKLLAELKEMNLYKTLSFVNKRNRPRENKIQVKPPEKKIVKDTAVSKPPITARTIEKIRDICFSGDSLELSIVDNGTVDGDTLSLELNGTMIATKIPLKLASYKIKIAVPVTPGDSLLLVMHAESLGSIPPNTGLLTISDGDSRHQIRFTGDYNKSSAIMLRKRK